MEKLHYIIYTSYALPDLQESDIQALLTEARKNNSSKLITGLLFYFDEKFLQLIEGEEKEVTTLYGAIEKDKRHQKVLKLKEGKIENRFFENWSMAFKATSLTHFSGMEGYKDVNTANGPNQSSVLKLFKVLSAET
jgi:hypothetical protein